MPAQERQEPGGIQQQEPDGIIERVEQEHKDDEALAGYKNDVPNLYMFCIYKLVFEKIFNMLNSDKKLRTFPIESLIEYETDLDKIAGRFYDLYGKSGLSKLPREGTQDFIDEASTQLSTAIDHREKNDMEKYLRHLKNCRGQLFSLKEHLDAVLVALKREIKNNETKPC